MSSITSAVGTAISYDRAGQGLPVVLVLGAFMVAPRALHWRRV